MSAGSPLGASPGGMSFEEVLRELGAIGSLQPHQKLGVSSGRLFLPSTTTASSLGSLIQGAQRMLHGTTSDVVCDHIARVEDDCGRLIQEFKKTLEVAPQLLEQEETASAAVAEVSPSAPQLAEMRMSLAKLRDTALSALTGLERMKDTYSEEKKTQTADKVEALRADLTNLVREVQNILKDHRFREISLSPSPRSLSPTQPEGASNWLYSFLSSSVSAAGWAVGVIGSPVASLYRNYLAEYDHPWKQQKYRLSLEGEHLALAREQRSELSKTELGLAVLRLATAVDTPLLQQDPRSLHHFCLIELRNILSSESYLQELQKKKEGLPYDPAVDVALQLAFLRFRGTNLYSFCEYLVDLMVSGGVSLAQVEPTVEEETPTTTVTNTAAEELDLEEASPPEVAKAKEDAVITSASPEVATESDQKSTSVSAVEAEMEDDWEMVPLDTAASLERERQAIEDASATAKAPRRAVLWGNARGTFNVHFDPHLQSNVPFVWGTFQMPNAQGENKEVTLMRLGSPTNEGWGNPQINEEFRAYIQHLQFEGKCHLYVSLQNDTPGKEAARSAAIKELQNEFPGTFYAVVLDQDSSFYKQKKEFGAETMKADVFIDQFMQRMTGSNTGFYFPEAWKGGPTGIFEPTAEHPVCVRSILKLVHQTAFASKADLTVAERKNFIEVAYAFLELFLVQQSGADSLNISCKDAIDRAGKNNSLLFYLMMILQNKDEDSVCQHRHRVLTEAPALLVKKQPIIHERWVRLVGALQQLQQPEVRTAIRQIQPDSLPLDRTSPFDMHVEGMKQWPNEEQVVALMKKFSALSEPDSVGYFQQQLALLVGQSLKNPPIADRLNRLVSSFPVGEVLGQFTLTTLSPIEKKFIIDLLLAYVAGPSEEVSGLFQALSQAGKMNAEHLAAAMSYVDARYFTATASPEKLDYLNQCCRDYLELSKEG